MANEKRSPVFGKVKYLLLKWLLNDICKRSECEKCHMDIKNNIACHRNKVNVQAWIAWRVTDNDK